MPSPFKLTQIYQALTAKNPLLKRKLKLGTNEIPIPPKRDDVTAIEAINRFNKDNPRVDTTNIQPVVKQSNVGEPDEGVIQGAFDTATMEARDGGYPAPIYEAFKKRYLKRNMKADGGRIGYNEGSKLTDFLDVQASGSKSGKQQIQGAPEGITSDKETINAIIRLDVPISEKIDLLTTYGYGKDRTKYENKGEELFLGEGGYKDRNIQLDYNRGGEGFSGSVNYGIDSKEPQLNIRYKFADGGMLVQPSDDGSRPGYSGEKGGKVGAKEVKDFKTNINNWTKNWIKENINNYEIRESNKFINDLKKAWAKESKNKKYKITGVDSAKGRVLTQNGFPAISTKKATNNFNIFGYEMPGGIKIENMGNAQRNLYSKIFYTNSLKKNPNLKKKINFYFDYITANKSGTNATTLPKTVTNIMKKANITDVKDLLDKDVMYLLSQDSGLGDKARYEFFNNNFGKKYNIYRDKVNTAHGNYIKNVQIIKDKTGINVKGQLTKENNALKKLFDVSELPVELRYSGDHLFGVAQAAKSNDNKFIKNAVNNLVGMTREQNRILGLGEFENTRKNLVNKINNSKGSLKNQFLNELNTLMSDTYKDYFAKNKNNFYSLNKEGKVNVSKDFVPLTQNERFTNYFKQINKTKEGKIAIKEQAGSLKKLIASLGPGTCSVFSGKKAKLKADGGRIGLATGTPDIDDCFKSGSAVINSGKVPVDKADDFAQLLKRVGNIGRGIMKFGIIPEALYATADSLIRVGMGDTFTEAGLRATDYLLPGDQTKAAEISKVSRIFGDETGELVGRTIDYKKQLAKIQSLEDQKANFENLSGGGEFDYIGDLSGDIKNTENLLLQAKNDLNNKFKISEAEQLYAESKQNDAYDASSANSLFSTIKRKYRDSSDDFDNTEQLAAPEKTQMQLNLNMLPQVPRDYMEASDDVIINYINTENIRRGEKQDPQLYIDERDKLKKDFMTKGPGVYGKEQVYGTQGTFGGEPVDMTNYFGPGNSQTSNRFGSQQRPILYPQGRNPLGLASGGIASLTDTIPPESGPTPQGLPYVYNNVKKI